LSKLGVYDKKVNELKTLFLKYRRGARITLTQILIMIMTFELYYQLTISGHFLLTWHSTMSSLSSTILLSLWKYSYPCPI